MVVCASVIAVPAVRRQTEGSRVQGHPGLYTRPCIPKKNENLENPSEPC